VTDAGPPLRIAHVVTYVSDSGSYGGPVTVAANQTRELAARGHAVELIAAWDGVASLDLPGVRTSLFPPLNPGARFSNLLVPALLRHIRHHAGTFDVMHVHLARDLITAPAARIALGRTRVVLQPHGMVKPDARPASRMFDALLIRPVLTGSAVALALTEREEAGLRAVNGREAIRIERIANGIAAVPRRERDQSGRPVILFLARLHPRKRVLAFAEAARTLVAAGKGYRFVVAGPDEGDGARLAAFIAENRLEDHLTYTGAMRPSDTMRALSDASVYVLPSFGEVFPMSVLEAIAVGTPTVMTADSGIAKALSRYGAAAITDGSPAELARAIAELVEDAESRAAVLRGADEALTREFGMTAVVDSLERAYRP
jgi:glycosyltransferase involved in cell wall biosynthesis